MLFYFLPYLLGLSMEYNKIITIHKGNKAIALYLSFDAVLPTSIKEINKLTAHRQTSQDSVALC